jgi:hypothetical protein
MHSDAAKFRHDLRNLTNSLRLAMAAMELEKGWADKIEWLNAIISTADRGVGIIDEYEPSSDHGQK